MSEAAAAVPACQVLQLLWSGHIGGIERQVAAVLRYADAHGGGGVRACFLDGRGVIGDALTAEGLADRLELRGGGDVIGLWRFARLLRRRRPAVIHSHTHALLPTLVARLALPHAAFVYTEQSPRALDSDRKFRILYRLLRLFGCRFIALTSGMARAIERYGVPQAGSAVIPNTFAIARRADTAGRARPRTIGIVARLEPQKRADLLIDVVAELRRRGVDCSGLIVGGGTRLPDLVAQATRLGLGDVIEFPGEQDDVVPWLDRMDVFLMTSALEPFGITALEAMARRVPVVAMPCPGGLSELAAAGGILLADRSIATAADAVADLLQNAERRRELQTQGEALVAKHTIERLFPRLQEVYRQAAGV